MKEYNQKEKRKRLKPQMALFAFLGFIILAFSLVFILTSGSIYPLTNTGEIGDTIGGITSPILTIGSSLLIYYSFKAQLDANEALRRDIDRGQMLKQYDQIYELITALLSDYNNLEYNNSKNGDLAIEHFLKENSMHVINDSDYASFLRGLAYVMESADFSSRKIYHFSDLDKSYKRVLRSRFDNFFAAKLSHHINTIKTQQNFSRYFAMTEDDLKREIRETRIIYAQIVLNIRNIKETLETIQYKK